MRTETKLDRPAAATSSPSASRASVANRPLRRSLFWLAVYGALIVTLVLIAAPYIYAVLGSFRSNAELYGLPVRFWPGDWILENYRRLLSGEEIPFVRQLGNSVIIAVGQTTGALLLSSMVGWGFAKYEFAGKRALFLLLLATLTLPFQVVIVPLFLLMNQLGLIDTYLAVMIPGAITAFGSFFMRQQMLGVPNELLDAARVDGASEWGVFWRIGLPLTRGALSVLAVLIFLTAWTDYLWPLIALRSSEKFTYPLGLASLVELYGVEYGMILAGTLIVTLPVIILFVAGRKRILDNFTVGAVKG